MRSRVGSIALDSGAAIHAKSNVRGSKCSAQIAPREFLHSLDPKRTSDESALEVLKGNSGYPLAPHARTQIRQFRGERRNDGTNTAHVCRYSQRAVSNSTAAPCKQSRSHCHSHCYLISVMAADCRSGAAVASAPVPADWPGSCRLKDHSIAAQLRIRKRTVIRRSELHPIVDQSKALHQRLEARILTEGPHRG